MGIAAYNRGSKVVRRQADADIEAIARRTGTATVRRRRQPGCSCGCIDDHIVARRTTADGADFLLWSDGTVTDRARVIYGKIPIASMWAAADLFGLFDVAEIRAVIREWKRAISRVRATVETARAHALAPTKPKTSKVARPGVVIGGHYYQDIATSGRPKLVRWL